MAARLVAEGADEQAAKQRQVRQPLPGLAVPDILRHPFFGQHMLAGRQQDGLEDLLAGADLGQPADCNHPARVHATLDLLGRHMAAMQQSLAPKLAAGRGAPPKKAARGAKPKRGKPGRRGMFAPTAKGLDRAGSKLGKRRRTEYLDVDYVMPAMPGARIVPAVKQSIAVPEVRLVPDAEQDRRRRAIQYLQAQAAGKDSGDVLPDIADLVGGPSAGQAVEDALSEDDSDAAFVARHALLEAQEHAKFQTLAGPSGGAQRVRRTKPNAAKPLKVVRTESMPEAGRGGEEAARTLRGSLSMPPPRDKAAGVPMVAPRGAQDAGAAAAAKSPAARNAASASLAVAVAVAPQQLQEPPPPEAATPTEPPVERPGLTKRQTRSEAKASPAASGKNGVRNGKGTKGKATPNSERRPAARRRA
eukprot:jgi/Astpho2/1072/Aster-07454